MGHSLGDLLLLELIQNVFREDEKYEEAISDLTEALKISPQNRDMHKLVMKVREELQMSKNNNVDILDAEEAEKERLIAKKKPIGSDVEVGFLDDATSLPAEDAR